MILIQNKQRKINPDIKALKVEAQAILDIIKYPDFDLGILLTNNKTIQEYNKEYRHKDKPTDILSFPYHPDLQAGKRIQVYTPEDKNLGDLIISLEYVEQETQKLNTTLKARLRIILVHGICHLLGYDHIEDHDWRRMRAKEGYILKKLRDLKQ
jgi:probable rRNA maturation factor